MPITPKHAFKEKSTKLLILLPLRTIYNRTFQCETPCIFSKKCRNVTFLDIFLVQKYCIIVWSIGKFTFFVQIKIEGNT